MYFIKSIEFCYYISMVYYYFVSEIAWEEIVILKQIKWKGYETQYSNELLLKFILGLQYSYVTLKNMLEAKSTFKFYILKEKTLCL